MMTEGEVFAAVKFWREQGAEWLAHLVVLPVLLVPLWGLTDLPRLAAWSAAALGYGVYVCLKGWVPWRMPIYQMARGRAFDEPPSKIQLATEHFINEERRRIRAGLVTSTALLTPWLAYAVTASLGLKPIGRMTQTGLPIWGFLVLGLADGIRAQTLAIRSLTSDVLRHWDELTGVGQAFD